MYKALISFSGIVSMACGDIKEIRDKAVAEDLLRAGYIEEVKPEVKPEVAPEEKPKTEETKPKKTKKK